MQMKKLQNIRNVAIIAHVDHGKTTLVDELFKQSGMYRDNQVVEERLMDSMDLERERGITIKSKNGSCTYKDYLINIIDTPGHADFGGEVERVLKMADGVVFLVDAAEGPMPQSYFVLKKAIALSLPVIVVVNKIDKPSARVDWVVDQVFDLMAGLDAPDDILDFPVVYASAKSGIATDNIENEGLNMEPIFQKIISHIPCPKGSESDPFKMLVSTISYSSFLGRLAIGKVTQGKLNINEEVVVSSDEDGVSQKYRITKIFSFEADKQVEATQASVGEIVALAGISDIQISQTISDPNETTPLKGIPVDPPTLSMNFIANNSPFSGQEGEFVTANHLKERLYREILTDAALEVTQSPAEGFIVSGRGELHLSILIEKMRREGYEFQVSRPKVILKEINGKKCEPFEEVTINVSEENMGSVIESLGHRKGQLQNMDQDAGHVEMVYHMPIRGLLGYQSEFMTQTKGLGTLYTRFLEYRESVGEIKTRKNGVLISKETAKTVAFALDNLQDRSTLFLGPGEDVYEGQIIGENSREEDMVVNPAKSKKLTNMRASGSDDSVMLTPPTIMSLEQCMSFIDDTELVECTPKAIRLRKIILSESDRKRSK